mmetsp:Transcript_55004/g.96487  ORF Transcript_55004/g.96487 Transcript_55004/m.96487 type:complete len:87 (+) Transcript_55004:1088-1348(+)
MQWTLFGLHDHPKETSQKEEAALVVQSNFGALETSKQWLHVVLDSAPELFQKKGASSCLAPAVAGDRPHQAYHHHRVVQGALCFDL